MALEDLDPLDGVAPAWIVTSETWSSSAQGLSESSGQLLDYATGSDIDTSAGLLLPNGTSSAATSASGAWARAELLGSLAPTSFPFISGGAGYRAQFALTPWSAVTLAAPYVGQATTTVGYVGGLSEYAYSDGYIRITVYGPSGTQTYRSRLSLDATYTWDGERYVGVSKYLDAPLSLTYVNLSSDTMYGDFSAIGFAYTSSTLPVPEAGTLAQLTAGLLLVAAAVRHRIGPGRRTKAT